MRRRDEAEEEEEWRHEARAAQSYDTARKTKPIAKTVTAAVVLFTVGSLMLYYGVQSLGSDRDRGLAMIVVGSIAFLPGSYASWNLYGSWREWPGYSYDSVPSYDD